MTNKAKIILIAVALVPIFLLKFLESVFGSNAGPVMGIALLSIGVYWVTKKFKLNTGPRSEPAKEKATHAE